MNAQATSSPVPAAGCGVHGEAPPGQRFLGIDLGAETIKVVEVIRAGGRLTAGRRRLAEHHKKPAACLLGLLREFDWERAAGAAASGRLARMVALPRIPPKQALAGGFRFLFGGRAATVYTAHPSALP